MTERDRLYAWFLQMGFVGLREAIDSGEPDWIKAELELLHNVPSLIGEGNAKRHQYFWLQERTQYLSWLSMHGPERAVSRMRTYYEPIWNELESLVMPQAQVTGGG